MVDTTLVSVLIAISLAGTAVGCFTFAWYSWRRADHPVFDRFGLVMTADGAWVLFSLFGHLSPTAEIALFWRPVVVVSASLAALFWFLFVVEYTADSEWLPPLVERIAVGGTVVAVALVALDPAGLVFPDRGVSTFGVLAVPYLEFGPLMLVLSGFTFLLLFSAFGLLGRFLVRSWNLYRKQAAVIFGVNFVVVLSSMLFVTGFRPHPRLDVTPLLFGLNALGTGVALYRYDFLNVEPMAAHTLLEEMSDPVFVVDTNRRLVDWNRAAGTFIDADGSRATIEDIEKFDLLAETTKPDGGERAVETASRTLSYTDEQGTLQTFDVRTTSIDDRYGIARGYAVVLRDITDQQQRKRALETQNKRLEEFTGVVSHDLRTPLQIIDGRLALARQTGDLSQLDAADDAVERMETMIDDLLRLAREGQTIDETESVAIEECATAAWDTVDAVAGTLVVETTQSVVADSARLQRLFENLFGNAVEHGSTNRDATDADDGVCITVGDTESGFYIADDGPGIPPSDRDSIFEFGTTHADDGTGFGLAIVSRIVEAHGWSITVTDSVDGGARFDISLRDRDQPAVDT